MIVDIYTDGACSGNPGPGGVGVVIKSNGVVIKEIAEPIGHTTNNIAEYTALIYGLKAATELKAEEVYVRADSELMCRQVQGKYAIKSDHIRVLFDQVTALKLGFKKFTIEHIRRELNAEADALSRQGIKKAGQDGRPDAAGVGEESPSSKG